MRLTQIIESHSGQLQPDYTVESILKDLKSRGGEWHKREKSLAAGQFFATARDKEMERDGQYFCRF